MRLLIASIVAASAGLLTIAGTLATLYLFPEHRVATDPWYEVKHALSDRATLGTFAAAGAFLGLVGYGTFVVVQSKVIRARRARNGLCLSCG